MRWRAIGIAWLCSLVLFCSLLVAACGGQPAIADKAVGWWQVGADQTLHAATMHLTLDGSAGAQQYQLQGWPNPLLPQYGYLQGDKLLVWGENSTDIVWALTYYAATDRLQATQGSTTLSFSRTKPVQ
jgi:hypothetical protein